MKDCTCKHLILYLIFFVLLAASSIWFVGNIQTYIQEVDSPKMKVFSTDTAEDSSRFINTKQSALTKGQVNEHKAEFPLFSLLSHLDHKNTRAVVKRLTRLDVFLLILAWASGIFFSKFASVVAKQL